MNQGERRSVDACNKLGEFTITGVERARKGEPKVGFLFCPSPHESRVRHEPSRDCRVSLAKCRDSIQHGFNSEIGTFHLMRSG